MPRHSFSPYLHSFFRSLLASVVSPLSGFMFTSCIHPTVSTVGYVVTSLWDFRQHEPVNWPKLSGPFTNIYSTRTVSSAKMLGGGGGVKLKSLAIFLMLVGSSFA